MYSFLRSALLVAVGAIVAIGVTTIPSRAGDEKDLQSRIEKLERKLKFVTVKTGTINGLGGPHLIIEGCNVHIRSGSGDSTDGTVNLVTREEIAGHTPLGLGNLVLGYNEEPTGGADRVGSHNLIVGPGHEYASICAVVFGQENTATGPLASVTGGFRNNATGYASSISGGVGSTASGVQSSVSGGITNTASGQQASVTGGNNNTASGDQSTVSGGASRSSTGLDDWRAGSLFENF